MLEASPHVSLSEPDRQQAESLLSRLLSQLGDHPPAAISFEDLTGVSLDNPQLHLPYRFRIHTCDFCMLAKANPDSHQHCVRNKMAANRVAIRRRVGFMGQCHLGLTDLIKPLIFQNTVLGVFYYGSFVLRGTENKARTRILRFCRHYGFESGGYLAALATAPRIDSSELPTLWHRLDLIADLANCIVENIGIPLGRYRTRSGAQFSTWNGAMSSLVRGVIGFINARYADQIRVTEIAAAHKCNADYLSRTFKRTVGFGVVEYLHRIRVDHARRLLQTERFTVGEVGFLVGFHDQSHFGKVFRKLVGISPRAFRVAVQSRETPLPTFSAFEYSNVRPFNPKFSDGLVDPKRLVM
ncbi:MAG: helix-turn-helix domain-containing protein [Opitutaceae bacterium]|nr:helix-turn-helix domain-containing protein [Opitutaceae bacterium]